MSPIRLILASLAYHWRIQTAVGCGVVAGTAVLTGALLVGDSMRGSLWDLTLDRLGRIDEILLTDQFFRAELAHRLAASPGFKQHFNQAVPAIILRASLENADQKDKRRANRVQLVGCDRRFWELGFGQPQGLARKQIVLNEPLADRLGVGVGDDVILHLPDLGTIPGDSPLGKKKSDIVKRARLTVSAIIPSEGLGRFSLRPNQQSPLNAYVSLAGLQSRLGQSDRANAILVSGKDKGTDSPQEIRQVLEQHHEALQHLLEPTLPDYGIHVTQNEPDLPPAGVPDASGRGQFRYINISSDRMLLEPEVEAAISRTLQEERAEFQAVFTYLANAIDKQKHDTVVEEQDDDGKIIPYSTITAIDFATTGPLGPFLTPSGDTIEPLDDQRGKQIVLNSWAADDLGVEPGANIYVTYFEPESTSGQAQERTEEFKLAAIVDLAGAAKDKAFTPTVPGVTDKRSMGQWEAPFSPFREGLIRKKDDAYWTEHGLTPKAFVSLATGQRLWGSRFGRTTGFRVKPSKETTVESLTAKLERELEPAKLGFRFQPVKRQGLDASVGTMSGMTSFSGLFIGFSFFIIAAAVMLVALLFRLGIDGRASQVGILLAVGFTRRQVTRLFAGEGLALAAAASLLGVAAGVGYAALMLAGMHTLWLEAIVTPFLRLHVKPASLAGGYVIGVLTAFAAIVWSVWRAGRIDVRRLLAGQASQQELLTEARPRLAHKLAWAMLLAAIALSLAAAFRGEEARAGAFFGAGAMVLVASLAMVWTRLRAGATGSAVALGRGNLLRMAIRNAARNPGRSTLTIGLVAAACFLIVSVSAFRLDPTGQVPTLNSGNGGYALMAESTQPIYQNLDTPSGRFDLGFPPHDSKFLQQNAKTVALRVKPGEDASCLNLYKPRQPRILGVPGEFVKRGGFVFTASKADTQAEHQNPWLLLEKQPKQHQDGVPRVPVILDEATAKYSLHLELGQTLDIPDTRGQTTRLEIAGLLKTSIFQGDLLMSEESLLKYFPETSGYRVFLVEALPERTDAVRNVLERILGDYGLAAETTGRRLAGFLAVQNTYLWTFQTLGGLGLLLGTFGLAAVQLRNVLERRGELAVLRATGFRRRALGWLVMLENALLLVAGLGCGLAAALVAVLPHLLWGGAAIPWGSLAGTLILVLAVGLAAGLAAVRATLSAPLLAALRQE